MKINDFDDNTPTELRDVNLIDDLQFFMANDPSFYRKIMFPEISNLKSKISSGEPSKETFFLPAIKKATSAYCKKFNIDRDPKDLFSDNEIRELAIKMFHSEKDNINQGAYK